MWMRVVALMQHKILRWRVVVVVVVERVHVGGVRGCGGGAHEERGHVRLGTNSASLLGHLAV